jgi:hypothetical protein
MDAIYYISGTLMTIFFIGIIIGLVLFLIKPHLLNKSKYISSPISRQKIFVAGLIALFVTVLGFSSVMAATEPTSVKEARATEEAREQNGAQGIEAVSEDQRLREEEARKTIVEIETKAEVIPFESKEQEDNVLTKGEARVITQGVNGERTITYEVTYAEGIEISRKETKNEVTKAPVAKITHVGTYEAPVYTAPSQENVYYKNCSAARVAGAAPVYAGEPGYGRHLDRDADGIGCE